MKNSKKIARTALGLGCLLFTACMSVEDIDEGDSDSPPPVTTAPTIQAAAFQALPLDIKVEPKSEMHGYQVRLFAPSAGGLPASLLVKRSVGPDGKNPVVFVLRNQEGSFIDETAAEGTRYRYEWGLQDGASVRMLGAGDAQIPVDVVFAQNSSTKLARLELSGGRVQFHKNARVFTDGKPVKWNVDSLEAAAGAALVTFEAGETAADGVKGRSGGTVSIVAVSAAGELRVEMRGERGGKGADGLEGLKGRNGSDAPLVNGKEGPRAFGAPIGAYFVCDRVATGQGARRAGGDGFRGEKGGNGGEGMKGGDSGLFTYRGPLENFELDARAEEGFGGEGGARGPGGPGGDPGKASHVTVDGKNPIRFQKELKAIYDPETCGTPREASPGEIGEPGDDGHQGLRGFRQAPSVNGVFR